MKNLKSKKILVVRNDKLGDFILSLPVYSQLKQSLPDCQIHVFIPEYTRDIALNCKSIDKIITDPGSSASITQHIHTIREIREQNYDAILTLYSTTRVGIYSFLSGVSYRLAPATKIAQVFYNHKLIQRRSRSLKPEYEYNLDLAFQFLRDHSIAITKTPEPPFLDVSEEEMKEIRAKFYEQHGLDKKTKLIFIHPGTGGSATNLSLEQYADLAKKIKINSTYSFVITAGPDEIENAKQLSHLLQPLPHIIYHSTSGLINFVKIIQLCELFISGSTGPLHIAGALNRPTAAFYQRRRSATPLRWQTLNTEDRRLAFTPPEDADESDMTNVDIIGAANKINEKFMKNL